MMFNTKFLVFNTKFIIFTHDRDRAVADSEGGGAALVAADREKPHLRWLRGEAAAATTSGALSSLAADTRDATAQVTTAAARPTDISRSTWQVKVWVDRAESDRRERRSPFCRRHQRFR